MNRVSALHYYLICETPVSLVGPSGLEPPTSCLSGTRSNLLSYEPMQMWYLNTRTSPSAVKRHRRTGGDDEIRTHDPLLAGQVLSQLSYTPGSFSFVFSRMWKRRPSPSCFSEGRPFTVSFLVRKRRHFCLLFRVGIELSSRAVSRKVFSPLQSLTSVFGMGTGGPSAFVTPTLKNFCP